MTAPTRNMPTHVDTVVVGGGVGGAIIAGRLAGETSQSVLLLEAGPDYGPVDSGNWPAELLDYTFMPVETHDWGYTNAAATGTPGMPLQRARVIGGCSSHNGCAAVWGWRGDYDAWAAAGNPGWDTESLLPLFTRADRALRVHQPTRDQVTPWHRACLDAGTSAGYPFLENINDVDAVHGIAMGPLNVDNGVRWNSAFAYLDPVRHRPNLTVVGGALVDRVVMDGTCATGVEVIVDGVLQSVRADRVVLCGGAYGSPLVLLRSGIGPAAEIAAHGIDTVLDLPGVGRNLQDHPATRVVFSGTPELVRQMDAFVASGGVPREEGTIVLASSSRCTDGFDLHLYPLGSRPAGGGWLFAIYSAVMDVKSKGTITLGGRDPEAQPVIDTGYFNDPDGADLAVLCDAVRLSRELAAQEPLRSLAGTEIEPLDAAGDLAAYVRANCVHDYHPAGTCKMGPASDPDAVVNNNGKVHGVEGLYVADAAIMPFVTRVNTNIPAAVIGERIADALIGS